MENKDEKKGILLESGTNELEIIEFSVGTALYGINIAKVREIIKADIAIVSVPDTHHSVEGAINLRGKIIPVVNLACHLKENIEFDKKTNRIIISEFNKITVGFLVSSVAKIHRLSWKQVEQPSNMLQTDEGYAVGIVKIDTKVIFLLDFEKIAAHINPRSSIGYEADRAQGFNRAVKFDRATKTILVAEDSDFIRKLIVDYLTGGGYKVIVTANGEEALEQLLKVAQDDTCIDVSERINLMITDIEMPQMDGLHLIKRVREDIKLRKLPCIAFSSMITPELSAKCKDVGSDAEISKPDIDKLVELVDQKVL